VISDGFNHPGIYDDGSKAIRSGMFSPTLSPL
jgi:hypothetical protein